MQQLRPLWEHLCAAQPHTIFQDFELNLLAARMFAGREAPYIVCAETSYGMAIVPAVVRSREPAFGLGGLKEGSLRLLGEELFDYRRFLCQGDPEILRHALAALAPL